MVNRDPKLKSQYQIMSDRKKIELYMYVLTKRSKKSFPCTHQNVDCVVTGYNDKGLFILHCTAGALPIILIIYSITKPNTSQNTSECHIRNTRP